MLLAVAAAMTQAATIAPTDAPAVDTTATPVDANATAPLVTAPAGETTIEMIVSTEPAPTASPCNGTLPEIQAVYNFTNGEDFKDLSENQQIYLYEVLAAAEACRLRAFITPETMQRTFLLTEDLALKYAYMYIAFLARSLEREGVVVPV